MRPVLFIDRDGVIVQELGDDKPINSFERLSFIPGVIHALSALREQTGYYFAMVSNQDGLGTPDNPEEAFLGPHQFMLQTLQGEGFQFDAIHIDKTTPEEQAPTRKPGIGMMQEYFTPAYDLEKSLVIGDRLTDLEFAKNMGCKAIWFVPEARKQELDSGRAAELGLGELCLLVTDDWRTITRFITGSDTPLPHRIATIERATKETQMKVQVNLDGQGKADISTGLHFFDHMLEQIARHSRCDLTIQVTGDLEVDEHHTIEDTAISLGQAFYKALGDKRGISRYGFLLPMDDSLAQVAMDFSGRPWLVWDVNFTREWVGDVPTEMFYHFFKSFSDEARCNISIKAEGDNTHHIAEAVFKAFAKSIQGAVKRDPAHMELPTTKGVLA